jgi:hypothetical protein
VRSGLLERAIVLAWIAVCVIVLAVVALAFYAIRAKSGRLKVKASLLRLVDFSIEYDSQAEPPRGELPPGDGS